jgi:CheY-like chemotaxis protein
MGLGVSALDRGSDFSDDERGVVLDDELGEHTPEPPQERLGGARADFVAHLGRRVADLSSLLRQIEVEPESPRLRDDLRRRLHALSAGARLLRFAKLAEEVGGVEGVLHEAADRGIVAPVEIAEIRRVLALVSALAWGEASVGETTPVPRSVRSRPSSVDSVRSPVDSMRSPIDSVRSPVDSMRVPMDSVRMPIGAAPAEQVTPAVPLTVLVVGPQQIADALASPLADGGVDIEVERSSDNATAIDLARAVAPDVIILDADRPGTRELTLALTADSLTELVPIVVLGRWSRSEEASAYVALGVARALSKPVSPDALRRAVIDAARTVGLQRDAARAPLGEVSLDDLGARLADELRRGLEGAALAAGRGARFDLGEGSEVLAAVWSAVARIRDIVTIHSRGEVRFAPSGPEGALPLASWLGGRDAGAASGSRALRASDARPASAISLEGKTIVVADDDPAVTWFLAGVLQAAGAVVHEAHDGSRALETAFRSTPDLVISDVLMPGIDGFALCRALKRDVVLRDVPVILLSWKEDLLQRVRELGADADGYLRKEQSAASIVQRVREVMRGRHRVAERLAGPGEVRGRLDGLTTRTLLGLACAHRPASIVSVRDAAFLYEIEIRDGRPARASRTSSDGAFERGRSVLTSLLGVGAGRFVVAPAASSSLPPELDGSLDEQLLPSIASARAAQRLLGGASLVSIERVDLAEDRMSAYAAATPEPARSLLRTLAAGASPRALITSGQAAPRLLEDVLGDVAAHGAITAIVGLDGEDLFEAAVELEMETLRGVRAARPPVAELPLDLGPVVYTSTPAPVIALFGADEDEFLAALPLTPAPQPLAPASSPRAETPRPPSIAAAVAVAVAPPPSEPHVAMVQPLLTLGSLTPPPVMPTPPRNLAPKAPPLPVIIQANEESPSRVVRRPSDFAPHGAAAEAPPAPSPSPSPSSKEPVAYNFRMWALFAVAGIVFAVGARLSRDHHVVPEPVPPPAIAIEAPKPVETAAAEAPKPVETAAPEAPKGPGESKVNPILPIESPLRDTDQVPPGQGMLEVVAGTSDTIFIDNQQVGNGPIIKRALAPKKEPYEIRVKLRGEERVRFVLIKEARLTKVRISPPWSR